MGKWSDLHDSDRIVSVLRPKGDPVGFKLFKTEDEAKKIGGFTKVSIALRQAIKLAAHCRIDYSGQR